MGGTPRAGNGGGGAGGGDPEEVGGAGGGGAGGGGRAPGPIRGGISWKWVGLSLPIVLAVQVGFVGVGIAVRSPTTASVLSLLAYFLGGMLVGRISPGVTIKEPAIAAVTLVGLNTVVQVALRGGLAVAGNAGTFLLTLLLSAVVAYGVTFFGARVGERLPRSQRAPRG